MRTSVTRAASGVVVAAAAVLALAGPASAGTTPVAPRVHTTLSIVESRNVIKAGHADVVSGRLAADRTGLGRHIVYLDRVLGKKLVPIKAEITGKHGWVSSPSGLASPPGTNWCTGATRSWVPRTAGSSP